MPQSIYTITLNPGLDRTLTTSDIAFNEVLRAVHAQLDWGGKGFNVSRALKGLGVDSIAMGFVGGTVGELLQEGIAGQGIETDFVHITGMTRTNTVIEEVGSGRYIKVNEAGPEISEVEMAALYDKVRSRTSQGDLWVLSGSLPPGVPQSVYATLVNELQAAGARVFLDASGGAMEGCAASPYLVKPNAEEASQITGVTVDSLAAAIDAAQAIRKMSAQRVALSLGAEGLLLAAGDIVVHAKPPSVEAGTVVGVGDALLAGLVYADSLGLDGMEMARWGVASGTAAAMGAGVSVGSLAEVSALRSRVHCSTL